MREWAVYGCASYDSHLAGVPENIFVLVLYQVRIGGKVVAQSTGGGMDIYECERLAKESGFDSATFTAHFPAGSFQCKWIDAYMGLFMVDAEGMRDGFVTSRSMDDMFPGFQCSNLSA